MWLRASGHERSSGPAVITGAVESSDITFFGLGDPLFHSFHDVESVMPPRSEKLPARECGVDLSWVLGSRFPSTCVQVLRSDLTRMSCRWDILKTSILKRYTVVDSIDSNRN